MNILGPAPLGKAQADTLYGLRRIPYLENVKPYSYGDSYGNNTNQGVDTGQLWVNRLTSRYGMQTLAQFAAPGTRMDQVLAAIQTNWTANGRGLVFFSDGCINDEKQYADTLGAATTAEAFRSCLTYLTAWSTNAATSNAVFFGPGWSAGTSSTTGSYVDVAFTGDTAYLLVTYVTGSGGTLVVKNPAGTTLATVTTGGYKNQFTGVVKLSGLGSGDHTVRATLTAGSATITGVLTPGTSVPTIAWLKPGRFNSDDNEYTRLQTYLAACQTVTADFPTVIPIDMGSGWDYTTMISADNTHPNEVGVRYMTERADAVLRANITAYREGQNWLKAVSSTASSGVYTIPALSYQGTGATAPAQVTGLAATSTQQVTLTWTRAADNGSTLTGYIVQASLAGANSWSTVATPQAQDTIAGIGTGLTATSSYDFRIAAVNAVGTGAYSALATATAGNAVTIIAADNFNRTDSTTIGATPTGAKTWTVGGPNSAAVTAAGWAISGNTLVCTAASGANGGADLFVDISQSDGTVSMKSLNVGTGAGLLLRAVPASGFLTTGYIFWMSNNTTYALSRRNGGTYTLLNSATATGFTPGGGDVWTVVMSGSLFTCKVNGVTLFTQTDATVAGTRFGIWSQSATKIVDDFSFTSAIL